MVYGCLWYLYVLITYNHTYWGLETNKHHWGGTTLYENG